MEFADPYRRATIRIEETDVRIEATDVVARMRDISVSIDSKPGRLLVSIDGTPVELDGIDHVTNRRYDDLKVSIKLYRRDGDGDDITLLADHLEYSISIAPDEAMALRIELGGTYVDSTIEELFVA